MTLSNKTLLIRLQTKKYKVDVIIGFLRAKPFFFVIFTFIGLSNRKVKIFFRILLNDKGII